MKEGKEEESNLNLLFETSWEVCNKIGGIYTVLSTKAKTLHKLYKDKVVLSGPMYGLTITRRLFYRKPLSAQGLEEVASVAL